MPQVRLVNILKILQEFMRRAFERNFQGLFLWGNLGTIIHFIIMNY